MAQGFAGIREVISGIVKSYLMFNEKYRSETHILRKEINNKMVFSFDREKPQNFSGEHEFVEESLPQPGDKWMELPGSVMLSR